MNEFLQTQNEDYDEIRIYSESAKLWYEGAYAGNEGKEKE